MKKDKSNLKITVPALLYIKSILRLYNIRDLSIKKMLKQLGVDVNKTLRVTLENKFYLKCEVEGNDIGIHFSEHLLRKIGKGILTFDVYNNGIWERFGFFKKSNGKTKLCRIRREQRGSLFLKNGDEIDGGIFMAGADGSEEIRFNETIESDSNRPFEIELNIETSILKDSDNSDDKYFSSISSLTFCVLILNDDWDYDFEARSNDELNDFLKTLNYREKIDIVSIYEGLCSIYGLNSENMGKNYRIDLNFSKQTVDGTLTEEFSLLEQNGKIVVKKDGVVTEYTRKVKQSKAHIRKMRDNKV